MKPLCTFNRVSTLTRFIFFVVKHLHLERVSPPVGGLHRENVSLAGDRRRFFAAFVILPDFEAVYSTFDDVGRAF